MELSIGEHLNNNLYITWQIIAFILHRFQCFESDFFATYEYYAHRTLPSVFVQEIKITNLRNQITDVDLISSRISDWPTAVTHNIKYFIFYLYYQFLIK